jgi:hypothetical protein
MFRRECQKHELLNGYPVLQAPGEIVAQFTVTVAILGSSTVAITGLDVDEKIFHTDNKIDDEEILKLLSVIIFLFIRIAFNGQRCIEKAEETKRERTSCMILKSTHVKYSVQQYSFP